MKVICDCGSTLDFVDDSDADTPYTEGKGWYKKKVGDIEIYGEHDQVFFRCEKCGMEIWIFT